MFCYLSIWATMFFIYRTQTCFATYRYGLPYSSDIGHRHVLLLIDMGYHVLHLSDTDMFCYLSIWATIFFRYRTQTCFATYRYGLPCSSSIGHRHVLLLIDMGYHI